MTDKRSALEELTKGYIGDDREKALQLLNDLEKEIFRAEVVSFAFVFSALIGLCVFGVVGDYFIDFDELTYQKGLFVIATVTLFGLLGIFYAMPLSNIKEAAKDRIAAIEYYEGRVKE